MAWQYLEKDLSENVKRINYDLIVSFGISVIIGGYPLILFPHNNNSAITYTQLIIFPALFFSGGRVKANYSSLKHSLFDFAYFSIYTFCMFCFSIYLLLKSEIYSALLVISVAIVFALITITSSTLVACKLNKDRKNRKERTTFSKSYKKSRTMGASGAALAYTTLNHMPDTYSLNQRAFIMGCGMFLGAAWYFFRSVSSGFNLYNELNKSPEMPPKPSPVAPSAKSRSRRNSRSRKARSRR